MNRVKPAAPSPLPEGVEPHVLALLGRLFERARQVLLAQDADGLRPSHYRLLSHVPPRGLTITELATVLAMTKQGVGQFVTQLQGSGHVQVATDESDRRRRVVTRTRRGDRLTAALDRSVAALERQWEAQVGAKRYRVFREVLEEIAVGGPRDDSA